MKNELYITVKVLNTNEARDINHIKDDRGNFVSSQVYNWRGNIELQLENGKTVTAHFSYDDFTAFVENIYQSKKSVREIDQLREILKKYE